MSKAQRWISHAALFGRFLNLPRIYPVGQHGGARKSKIGLEKATLADFPGVTKQRVADARVIIEWAPDLDLHTAKSTRGSRIA